jgi:hypothetical protein
MRKDLSVLKQSAFSLDVDTITAQTRGLKLDTTEKPISDGMHV